MEIVRRDRLIEFAQKHPNTRPSLNRWYGLMRERNFGSFTELRSLFPHVSRVGKLTIFNIAGNNVRLIVSMRYDEERVYIRHVLTHAEYDKGKWKE